jgi:transposase
VRITPSSFYEEILGLKSPWRVASVTSDIKNKSITVVLEYPKGRKAPCPTCEKLCGIYDHRPERTWRHLDTMQFKTLLKCAIPRTKCSEHGAQSLPVPWSDPLARFTHLFERFAIDVLRCASSQTKGAELLGLSWDEMHHIQERAVKRGMLRRKLDELEYLGIDEKSFLKGQSYVSILYDLTGSRVLEVTQERTEESATALVKTVPEEVRPNIKAVAVDMWEPFLNAARTALPEADIVHDKYHIVSHLT